MRALKPLEMAASIVAAIGVIGTAAWSVDARWTPRTMFAGYQQQVQEERTKDLQQYQTDRSTDLLDRTNDRLWDIRQKLKREPNNEELLKEKETLMERKKRLNKTLDVKGGR